MMATERASLANGGGGGDGEIVEVTGEVEVQEKVEVQWMVVQQVEVMAAFWRIKKMEFSMHCVQSEPGHALNMLQSLPEGFCLRFRWK